MSRSPVRTRHARLAAAALCSLALTPWSAAAQSEPTPQDRAIAEALFIEGRRLMEEGRYPEACSKLQESQRLDRAPGTTLNLAVCHEKEGKLATAWGEFKEALAVAKKDGRADREKLARERIQAIEPLIPRLLIEVPPEARVPGLEVFRDGTLLGPAAWGTPIFVDPGTVVVRAQAPGYEPWSSSSTVERAATARVAVPALVKLPEPPAPAASSAAPVAPPPPPPPASAAPPVEPPDTSVAGVVLVGLGVVGLGVGSYFGLQALDRRAESDDLCPTDATCTPRGVELNEQAYDAALIANLGLGAGVLLTAVGGWLLLSDPPAPAPSQHGSRPLSWSVGLGSAGAGAAVGGRF